MQRRLVSVSLTPAKVYVIHAHNLPAVHVDDLLVDNILVQQ
jgi:hypothetical protein